MTKKTSGHIAALLASQGNAKSRSNRHSRVGGNPVALLDPR
jgi:hypothetical protein